MPYQRVNGVRLYYQRAGRGEPEILFVPGWCSDHTAFRPQFDQLAEHHAVTAIDPRGCGKSERTPDGYRISDLADDVAGFCREVGIERPVVIGHSVGGMVGIELGSRRPCLPRALILVDPGPIHAPPETVRFFDEFADKLAGPDGEQARRSFVRGMQPTDAALAREVAGMMCAVPLPIATAVVRTLTDWHGLDALARCDVPTLLLRPERTADADAPLLEGKPDMIVGITVGGGHFHQLEVPEQVTAMIDRFLRLAT